MAFGFRAVFSGDAQYMIAENWQMEGRLYSCKEHRAVLELLKKNSENRRKAALIAVDNGAQMGRKKLPTKAMCADSRRKRLKAVSNVFFYFLTLTFYRLWTPWKR